MDLEAVFSTTELVSLATAIWPSFRQANPAKVNAKICKMLLFICPSVN